MGALDPAVRPASEIDLRDGRTSKPPPGSKPCATGAGPESRISSGVSKPCCHHSRVFEAHKPSFEARRPARKSPLNFHKTLKKRFAGSVQIWISRSGKRVPSSSSSDRRRTRRYQPGGRIASGFSCSSTKPADGSRIGRGMDAPRESSLPLKCLKWSNSAIVIPRKHASKIRLRSNRNPVNGGHGLCLITGSIIVPISSNAPTFAICHWRT